jgi:phosphoglycolate phosphatase
VTRLAIFDCDGTLVDSQANICRAMEQCFAEHDLAPPSRPAIRGIVGLSLVPAIARLLPEAAADRHESLAAAYKRAFSAMRSAATLDPEPLYPGIAELLDALQAAGWLLGVATGKTDRGLQAILDHHGLTGRFATLQTADRHPSKPDPAMVAAAMATVGAAATDTVMIGDTSFDMAMARNAGVRALGVGWGYHSPAALFAGGADAVATDAAALRAQLLGRALAA